MHSNPGINAAVNVLISGGVESRVLCPGETEAARARALDRNNIVDSRNCANLQSCAAAAYRSGKLVKAIDRWIDR